MTKYYGFEMSGLSWNAFTLTAMFDRRWYLRPERLVSYTITMLIGMAAQCAATFCMFKYEFLQNHIEAFTMHQPFPAHVHNNDIIAAGILSMVLPCIVLLLFTVEYFLLILWPGQTYSRKYNRGKKWLFIAATVGMLATAVLSTVFVAKHSASITGVDAAMVQQLTTLYFRPPLRYRSWPQNIAWIVLLWIAVVSNIASTFLLVRAVNHDEKYLDDAPKSDTDVMSGIHEGSPELVTGEEEKASASTTRVTSAA